MGENVSRLERGAHLVGAYLDATIGKLGLTQGEAHVLAQVALHGPVSIAILHHEFGHKRSTLTNLLDRLEKRKLLRREINRADRRSIVVNLTPAGERAAREVTNALDKLERQLAGQVGKSDIAGLHRVVAALEKAVQHKPG